MPTGFEHARVAGACGTGQHRSDYMSLKPFLVPCGAPGAGESRVRSPELTAHWGGQTFIKPFYESMRNRTSDPGCDGGFPGAVRPQRDLARMDTEVQCGDG